MEAMDFWERESDFHARTVTLTRGGRVEVQLPARKRPIDDVQRAMATLHTVGFIRAIAGAMDCFGAVIVGVTALKVRLLRADLDNARRALRRVKGNSPGARAQREFSERLEAAIERSGPPGWLRWAIDLRNMLIHRGRRLEMAELRPVPSGIVGPDGKPVIRTDLLHQLPRDPGRSDVEMFLDMSRPPVLTESAAMTLLGVLDSTVRLLEEGGTLLRDVWHARRGDPALLLQPREQWPDGPSSATTGFPGYAPDSVPYNPTQLRSDETLVRRMTAASLGDAAREAWNNFD